MIDARKNAVEQQLPTAKATRRSTLSQRDLPSCRGSAHGFGSGRHSVGWSVKRCSRKCTGGPALVRRQPSQMRQDARSSPSQSGPNQGAVKWRAYPARSG